MEFPDYFMMAGLEQLQRFNDSLFHNNFSGGYNETEALLPTGVKVTIVVVYMIVCVIGLVGNFLVMYVVIRSVGPNGVHHTFTVRATFVETLVLSHWCGVDTPSLVHVEQLPAE